MHLMISNQVTGETVSTDSVKGLKAIRGVIRDWMKDGLSIHDFMVREWSDIKLYYHLRDYAWQRVINECDICKIPVLNGDMVWVDDYAGVCIMAACKDCMNVTTDDDIAEWQGDC
jgi:hypothetical protein